MGSKQRKHERREEKLNQRELDQKRRQARTSITWVFVIILFSSLTIWGVSKYNQREVLPPTDMTGHVETSPESHILDEPMPIAQQKHMLEHADAVDGGVPGVVINYNCEDFDCEDDLITNLEDMVNQYPEFVYLAPFDGMTVKIAITRLGEIETFDEYDEQALIDFIEN